MAVFSGKRIAAPALLLVFIISACGTSSNYNVLSFFFDGVPDPNAKNLKSEKVVFDSTGIKKREEILRKATPKFILHGPFGAKMCGDCHNVDQGFALLKKEPDLCFKCHSNFETKVKFPHGPVAAGLCTACHKPHKSVNKFLLVRKEKDLCFFCHSVLGIKQNKKHPEIVEDVNCVSCHNPHGNDKKYFLRR